MLTEIVKYKLLQNEEPITNAADTECDRLDLQGGRKDKSVKRKKEQKHILPSVVECDLHTGENRILEYVELSNEQYQEQIIDPIARILYEAMKRDIETGKFKPGEIEKE